MGDEEENDLTLEPESGETAAAEMDGGGGLEAALAAHEDAVDRLLKAHSRLGSAVKGWKKACQVGHLANRQKAAAAAHDVLADVDSAVAEATESWDFDVHGYLDSERWRREVEGVAHRKYGLRVVQNEAAQQLVSSPVAVSALPGRSALRIGRATWPAIRPTAVAAELKRLHDRVSEKSSQEFLESLYKACEHESRDGRLFIAFHKAYELFSLAPGFKKETPRDAFAEALYALHRSGVQATRGGKVVQWEWPSGKVKEREVFTVLAEDGRALRYYGMWFR
jgi:hypothetical protein